ncbi:CBS domain-containing protein [Streptomyces iconiensis]|uniref:CBS domain-containing protein n=1 Tax=Streptomyces iconiensis TaxID=1384038 RepID=A0ABT6ZQF1_9ACTN|nr:CBS domain-containing protein [Streptomyces iconiensis]MDJ1131271.1 CBS domain-containing protein [Streptomyces iconiensis]
MPQQVRDLMTPAPVTVAPETPVVDVAQRMRSDDVGAVLVVEDGQLKGLVTDRDLVVRILADGGAVTDRPVGDACSEELLAVGPDDDVDRALTLVRRKAVRRLPVVENDEPIGILSLGDLAIERDPDSALGQVSASSPNE